MTAILGISAFYHDSAAALVVDGDIVAAVQEERFTREKYDARLPKQAIAYCLQEAGLRSDQLDYVAFYDKPLTKFERLLETYLAHAPAGLQSFRMAMPVWLKDKLHLRRAIRQGLPGPTRAAFLFMDHHQSHAASAFFPSPYDEAAILTARRDKRTIGMSELEEAIDRVMLGPERKSRVISEKEKMVTAYHEVGHALVAKMLPNCDPVHKISIVARGMAGGYTMTLPPEDRHMLTRSQMEDRLCQALGGQAAEEIAFQEITTGASNDLEQATDIARHMVTRYGMSRKLGPRT